jgi:hypothetical protein
MKPFDWTPPPKLFVAEYLRASHHDMQWIAWNALSDGAKNHFLDDAEKAIRAVARALAAHRDGVHPVLRADPALAQRITKAEKAGEPA